MKKDNRNLHKIALLIVIAVITVVAIAALTAFALKAILPDSTKNPNNAVQTSEMVIDTAHKALSEGEKAEGLSALKSALDTAKANGSEAEVRMLEQEIDFMENSPEPEVGVPSSESVDAEVNLEHTRKTE